MSEWVTLIDNMSGTFETLQKACLEAPVLTFADFNKPFLLETDASKLGAGYHKNRLRVNTTG